MFYLRPSFALSHQDGAIKLFVAMFMLGLVFGLISITIAMFKTRSAPRWLVPLVWVFIVWDVGLGIAGVDPQIAGAIDPHMVAFFALSAMGLMVLRQTDAQWQAGEPLTWPSTPLGKAKPALVTN